MLQNPACPICGCDTELYDAGTTTPEIFFTTEPSYHIAAGQRSSRLPFYRCTSCGHGFAPLNLPPKAISDWYARSPQDEVFLQDEAARRVTAQKTLHHLGHHITPPSTLFDIGAGPGLFLDEVKKRGWQVQGLEPAGWAVDYAHHTLRLTSLRHGTIHNVTSYPAHTFDVVTSFDVIEHLVTPGDLVAAVSHVLKPGGILLLTTPRFNSFFARLSGTRWHALFPAHIHLFSNNSLQHLLKKHGFTIVQTKTHTRYLSAKYFWYRLRSYLGFPSAKPLPIKGSWPLPINLGDEIEIYARK